MSVRLYGQNCKFLTTPLSRNCQKRLDHRENQTKYTNTPLMPQSHVRIIL